MSRDFARYVSGLWALFRTFQYYAQENCPKNTGPVPRVAPHVSGQLRVLSQLFVLFRSRALRCEHRSAICADFAAPIYRYIGVISDDLRCDSNFKIALRKTEVRTPSGIRIRRLMLSLRLSRKLKFSLTLWAREPIKFTPVSYTHLTLPTIYSV